MNDVDTIRSEDLAVYLVRCKAMIHEVKRVQGLSEDYLLRLLEWVENKVKNSDISLNSSILGDDCLKYLDYYYMKFLELEPNLESNELLEIDRSNNRQLSVDINTFLDFLGVDDYKYNDVMLLGDGTSLKWTIHLYRDCYSYEIERFDKNSIRKRSYTLLNSQEVQGLYERLITVINVKLRFINLKIVRG